MMKQLIVMLTILTICAVMAACTDDNVMNSVSPSNNNVASPSSIIPESSPTTGATHATDEVRVTETASATNNGL